jgi:hypothetical protein
MRSVHLHKRGSVLLPVVAAMLILLLAGVALTELFAAQRYQTVQSTGSSRAFWIAEAGLWHAAYEGAAISTAVPLSGGSYTVTKSGDEYTSTAVLGQTTRVVTRTLTGSGGGGGGGPTDPVDEVASLTTLSDNGNRKIEFYLVSESATDAVLESFSISADVGTEQFEEVELDGTNIWSHSGIDLPTGVIAMNLGSTSDRTLEAGDNPEIELDFEDEPSGTINYTLVLNFTDGSSSTLEFAITW